MAPLKYLGDKIMVNLPALLGKQLVSMSLEVGVSMARSLAALMEGVVQVGILDGELKVRSSSWKQLPKWWKLSRRSFSWWPWWG